MKLNTGINILLCRKCKALASLPGCRIYDLNPWSPKKDGSYNSTEREWLLISAEQLQFRPKCENCQRDVYLFKISSDRDYHYCHLCFMKESNAYLDGKGSTCVTCRKKIEPHRIRLMDLRTDTDKQTFHYCSYECQGPHRKILRENVRDATTCYICPEKGKFRCSKCNDIRYCSKEHQIADWPRHKPVCKVMTS